MIRVLILIGCLTWYAGPYVDEPLRCGGVYDDSHEWIAVDIDHYSEWQCNDLARVTVGDDEMRGGYAFADARDAIELKAIQLAGVLAWEVVWNNNVALS